MWHRRLARKQAHPPIHRTEHRREIMSDPKRLSAPWRILLARKTDWNHSPRPVKRFFFQSVDHPRHPLALENEPFRISALRCRGPTDWVRTRPRRLQAPSASVFLPQGFIRSSSCRRVVCPLLLRLLVLGGNLRCATRLSALPPSLPALPPPLTPPTPPARPPSIHVCPSERPARANLMVRVRFWSRFHLECI